MRTRLRVLLGLLLASTCASLIGCGRDEVRMGAITYALADSGRPQRGRGPLRPLVRYEDLAIADSLADPDSIRWLRLVHVRWDYERYVERVARLSPPDSVFEAIRAARDQARLPLTM